MTIRRNPIANAVKPQVKEAVTAGTIDQVSSTYVEGFCPHCNRAMVRTTCDGIPSFVCEEHRTVLPVRSVQ